MKTFSLVLCLVAAVFVVGALGTQPASADEAPDVQALVGKWVWNQGATCATCKPFTTILTITSVSPDGSMTGTYDSTFRAPGPHPVHPRATVANGKIKVTFKAGRLDFDLDYAKGAETLKGPVTGFSNMLQIREAEFRREK